MNKFKPLLSLGLASMLLLAGCGQSEETGTKDSDSKKEVVEIGVTQIVEHPSLDAAFSGFKKALEENGFVEGDNVEYDVQNAQGDMNNNSTIANNLVGNKVDLIFANSTPSAQAALSATQDIPIVFTSVTDPIGAQLVQTMEEPGANVTGTTDSHPDAIPNTLKFIKDELGLTKVGLIYNAGEQNSVAQVEAVKSLLNEIGLEPVEASVSTSAEVKQAAESLVGRAESFYIVTDNTVVSAIESVVNVANENDMPLLTAELDSLDRGAFAAFGFEYYDIGYEAGLKAAQILKGEKQPSEIPVQYPQNLMLVINENTANEIGVEVKGEWEAELIK